MKNRTSTKQQEKRLRTKNVRDMIGNYLAAPAVKTWTEDFIDEDTGEIVSIERHEVIFQKGTKIDADLAARIQFCIESGEIEDVEVSNQCRQAVERNLNGLYPWKVRAHIDSKNYSFILQAQNVRSAVSVATDYIELNYVNSFWIVGAQMVPGMIIIDNLKKSSSVSDTENEEGEEKDDEKYYKIDVEVSILDKGENDDDKDAEKYTFLAKAKNVDMAKEIINAWIARAEAEKAEREGEDYNRQVIVSVTAAAPYSCDNVISREFCMAYKEEKE